MKKVFRKTSLLLATALMGVTGMQAQKAPQDMDRFIDALMKKMTVEEKIGQLNLPVTGDITTGQAKSSDVAQKIEKGLVGGLFNLKGVDRILEVQKLAVEKSRLGIPLLFGMDVIHGYETIFPIPLGLSIRTESGRVEGVLYVLPFRTQFSVRNSHKVYLKRMLLSEDDCNLLPQWAFFIRCLVNADGLLSTASRESLVSNDLLKDARKEIGMAIKDYLRGLVQNNRAMFNKILDVHHFHIKAIASEDNELLRLFMDYLPFETNKGVRSFGSIRSADNVICYTRNLEDFRQVRRIAGAQGWLVVNAAYTFDETLLKKYARLNPELTLDEISPSRLLEQFGEVEAKKEFRAFEAKANELLKRFGCVCRLKHFTPADIPVIFVAEEKESTTKSTNNPLAAVLGTVNTTRQIPPTLTFNADNEMVRTLLQIQGDNKMFQHVVHILYVQSLLQGKYPVNSEEMELFNHSLSELMTAKMNDFINFLN